jgi:hypothetical protein
MFKDYLQADIDKVFINTQEYAEPVFINGVSVNIVQDKEQLEYKLSKDTRGLINGNMLFSISETEYCKIPKVNKIPRAGDVIMYDSKPATICDVSYNAGLYQIIIESAGMH